MTKSWLLGYLKGTLISIYLYDFEWVCNWYWAGGYIGNKLFHAHFKDAFLKDPGPDGHVLNDRNACFITPNSSPPEGFEKSQVKILNNTFSVWENLSFFLDNAQYDSKQWWRIKDLFKQFYTLKDAAEVFQYGGHCTASGRNPEELNPEMAASINKHIETIIIPEIRKALDKEGEQ